MLCKNISKLNFTHHTPEPRFKKRQQGSIPDSLRTEPVEVEGKGNGRLSTYEVREDEWRDMERVKKQLKKILREKEEEQSKSKEKELIELAKKEGAKKRELESIRYKRE